MTKFLVTIQILFLFVLNINLTIAQKQEARAIIGIDFGSSYYKVNLLTAKQNVIVESMSSQRKIETAISFTNQQRQYEQDAVNKKARYPENAFVFINKFMGALENKEKVIKISKEFYENYIINQDSETNSLQFELKKFTFENSKNWFSSSIQIKVEELGAMILQNAKHLSEKMLDGLNKDKSITDCMITIPTHWDQSEKNALLSSAKIVGLNIVGFVSENSAAAITYALNRNTDDFETVLFYNVGASNIQASVIQVSTKLANNLSLTPVINVLSDFSLPNGGGQSYDLILAEHFAEEIDILRKSETSVKQNPNIMLRLLKECRKVKEVLSANKEARINIEGLYDNQDFQSQISRDLFLQKSQQFLDMVLFPVEQALAMAKKQTKHIDSVEMLGGGVRIPKIQEILKQFFTTQEGDGSNKIGAHLNGDESMAQGASHLAAVLTKKIKVKDIIFNDGYNHEFILDIQNVNKNIQQGDGNYVNMKKSLPFKTAMGTKEIIKLETLDDIIINIIKKDYLGQETSFIKYTTNTVQSVANHANYNKTHQEYPYVQLTLEVDSIKGINITKSDIKFGYLEKTAVPDKKKSSSDMTPIAGKEAEKEYTYKRNFQKLDLKYDTQYPSTTKQAFTDSQIKNSQKFLEQFDEQEVSYKAFGQMRNKLEQITFETKYKVEDANFKKFSTEAQIAQILRGTKYTEQWLHDNISPTQEEVQEQLKKLEELILPIENRIEQHKLRSKLPMQTRKEIAQLKEKMLKLETSHPWIPYEQINKLNEQITKTQNNIKRLLDDQKKKPLTDDPLFQAADFFEIISLLNQEHAKMKKIKKPKRTDL